MGSARRINQVLSIAEKELSRGVVLVASAMGKTTDALLRMASLAERGETEAAGSELDNLRDMHFSALVDLLEVPLYEEGKSAVDRLFKELESLMYGLSLIQEVSPRSMDTLLSFGERLSTSLIYYRALQKGLNVHFIDSRQIIKTDSHHGKAGVLEEETRQAITTRIQTGPGLLFVAQGFIASDSEGSTTTLGRGGSDYSATIIGAALEAEEVQIWTDVNGIMTSDPRLIPNAQTIGELSYDEAAELSYFGAKVIHPSTIQPAVEKRIPVWVKNTSDPEGPASRIHISGSNTGIQAIAGKKAVTLINVRSSRMLNAYGFLRRIFEVFETYRVPVDLVATSEVSVSLTIDDGERIAEVKAALEVFSTVTVERDKAIISLVGQDLWKQSRFTARVFSALVDIPVRMISLGSSDINLSLVIPEDQLDSAIQSLHDALFAD